MKLNSCFSILIGLISIQSFGQGFEIEETNYGNIVDKLKGIFDLSFDTDCLNMNYDYSVNISLSGIETFINEDSSFSFNRGFVLSTGEANKIVGPNKSYSTSTVVEHFGGIYSIQEIMDNRLGNLGTYSESKSIKVDFNAQTDIFALRYIFASESYGNSNIECFNGNSSFQDGFAIILSGPGVIPDTYDDDNNPNTPNIEFSHGGKNIALLPDNNTEVGLHSVHNNSVCSNTGNSQYFIDNPIGYGTFEANGYTVPLTAQENIIPGENYTLEIIITNRGDSSLDSWLLVEFPEDPLVPNLEQEYFICRDESNVDFYKEIVLDTGINLSNYSFRWYYEDNLIQNQSNSTLLAYQPGVYSVDIISPNGCYKNYSTIVTPSSQPYNLSYSLNGEIFTDHQNISVSADGIGDYIYELDGKEQISNTFLNISPGQHTLVVRDLNGCGEGNITFEVLDYPKFFTPNGDGINDLWNINFDEIGTTGIVKIFDRYGTFICHLDSNNVGWDGRLNGRELPSTDYWFIVEFQDGYTFRNHFALKR